MTTVITTAILSLASTHLARALREWNYLLTRALELGQISNSKRRIHQRGRPTAVSTKRLGWLRNKNRNKSKRKKRKRSSLLPET